MNTIVLGNLLALIPAFTWAQNSIAYMYLGKHIRSEAVNHIRLWIALPILFILSLVLDKGAAFSLSPASYGIYFLSGYFGFFLTDLILFKAYQHIGPRQGLVIFTLNPIFSTIMLFVLKGEILAPLEAFGIILTISGILVMIRGEHHEESVDGNTQKGYRLAFIAAILQATSYVILTYAPKEVPAVSSNMLRAIGGLIGIGFFELYRKNFIKDFKCFSQKKDLMIVSSAAILGPILGMWAQLTAFAYIPVGVATSLAQLSPLVLLPADIFIYKKKLSTLSILGTCISVLGVILLFQE